MIYYVRLRFSSVNVQQQSADVLELKLLHCGYLLMKACSLPFSNRVKMWDTRSGFVSIERILTTLHYMTL